MCVFHEVFMYYIFILHVMFTYIFVMFKLVLHKLNNLLFWGKCFRFKGSHFQPDDSLAGHFGGLLYVAWL